MHRSLWPELLALATAKEPWQTKGLTTAARRLWKNVEREDTLRLDSLCSSRDERKSLSKRARELETRLLVHGSDTHTDSGAHQKTLSSWSSVAETFGVSFEEIDPESARRAFEARTEGKLPWLPKRPV